MTDKRRYQSNSTEDPSKTHLRKKLVFCGAIAAAALSGTVSCGSALTLQKGMDSKWQWDGGVEASRVFVALSGKKAPEPVAAAVGVTAYGLIGRILPDGKRWTFETPVDVLPTIVGDTVLFSGDGKVTAIDLRTGQARYTIDVSGRRLEGAGYDGTYSILLLVDKSDARADEVRIVGPAGEDIHRSEALARIGTPAAISGVGLVPYHGQYIGAVELATGKLIGRILYRDGVHTVTATDQGTFVWGAGATLLEEKMASSPESHSLKLDARSLPGDPQWPVDGSKPRPARGTPVGLYASPIQAEGKLRLAQGAYVATYYQIVASFEGGTNRLRWANHLGRDVLSAASDKSGPTLCLEDGTIVRLDLTDGGIAPFGALDARLKACAVSAGRGDMAASKRPPLMEQIIETLQETGPDMVAMQTILLEELGKAPGPETTSALLKITQDPVVSSDLARKAGALLEKQTEGGEEMVRVLREYTASRIEQTQEVLAVAETMEDKSTGPAAAKKTEKSAATTKKKAAGNKDEAPLDPKSAVAKGPPASEPTKAEDEEWTEDDAWRDDRKAAAKTPAQVQSQATTLAQIPKERVATKRALRPPPVASLAVALTRMKTPGAAEALAPYLDDPSLGAKQVREVMHAIFVLGDQTEVDEVHSFLTNYKNTGGEEDLITALFEAAYFLYTHMDEAAADELQKELAQSLTHPTLRAKTSDLREEVRRKKASPQGENGSSQ